MAINDIHFRTCRNAACTRRPARNGWCASHQNQVPGNTTSDGRITGPKPKLSDDQVAEARRMLSRFSSKKDIAAHLSVTVQTLNRALRRPRPELSE